MDSNNAKGRVSSILGVALVGLGALFLVGRMLDIDLMRFIWPFFIIGPGLMFFAGMVLGKKPAGPLAIPGSIVTMTGLILLYQSIFNVWGSWAYIWTLIIPTSIGIGLVINGIWSEVPSLKQKGEVMVRVGAIMFLGFGALFELLIFPLAGDGAERATINNIMWPLLLIGIGIYVLRQRQVAGGNGQRAASNGHRPAEQPVAKPRPILPASVNGKREDVEFEPLDPTRGKM
jgi:hypothetical protein